MVKTIEWIKSSLLAPEIFVSSERPRVLKNAAKMEVGLDIYLWNPT